MHFIRRLAANGKKVRQRAPCIALENFQLLDLGQRLIADRIGRNAFDLQRHGGFFAKDEAERRRTGAPRRSLRARYGDYETYLRRRGAHARELAKRRYLLEEDVQRLLAPREDERALFDKEAARRASVPPLSTTVWEAALKVLTAPAASVPPPIVVTPV